jgi:hypothetical protein
MTGALDIARLVNARTRGGKLIARCPACAAEGADKHGEHLVVFDEGRGRWGCVLHPGDKNHRRQIAAALGDTDGVRQPRALRPLRALPQAATRELVLPALRFPTVDQLATLATLRGLPVVAGLELAARAGMLRVATTPDAGEPVESWVLLDSSRRCAQARRLDGRPWASIGGAKAKTLPGSQAAWPIGAADIGSRPFVALCEGGPDTLAAWTLIWWHGRALEIAPVCICGAGVAIHRDALPHFRGKGVWTFPHRDGAGERAQVRWRSQLLGAGASWVRPFDVSPHKDLNAWLTAAATESDANQ